MEGNRNIKFVFLFVNEVTDLSVLISAHSQFDPTSVLGNPRRHVKLPWLIADFNKSLTWQLGQTRLKTDFP